MYLSIFILEQITEASVQNARFAFIQSSRMEMSINTVSRRFDADQLNFVFFRERMKYPQSITSSANTGNDCIRKSTVYFFALDFGFFPDN